MNRAISKLIVYREVKNNSILGRIADICGQLHVIGYDKEDLRSRVLDEVHNLLDLATDYGFDKNLWHNYIAYLLAMTETPFTLVSEKVGSVDGSVNEFVKSDLAVFKELLDYDFKSVEDALDINCFSVICDYRSVKKKEHAYNKNVSIRIRELSDAIGEAKDVDELYDAVMDFYRKYGVGQFGMNKAFRVSTQINAGMVGVNRKNILTPIIATSNVVLDDLIGYELQKEQLVENTEAFINGRPANNVLLYGDAGTGKSTSIKALLNMYYEKGLRIIEIYRHEFKYLPEIISIIKGRNYKFIIYMDDLSFETGETEYKYLKAVIEGDLEARPDNVLIYATSNRRHLLKEKFSDRDYDEDDIHHSDTVSERLSLSGRFGLSIAYFRPERQTFYDIVKALAKKQESITMDEADLLAEADKWAIRHGGLSGRVAQQFVDHLAGSNDD